MYDQPQQSMIWRIRPLNLLLSLVLTSTAIASVVVGVLAYLQEDRVAMLVAALPIVLISLGLLVWFFDRIFLGFLVVAPFYYLPTLFIGTGSFGEEGFWLRAGKDIIVLILFAAWVIRTLLRGKVGFKLNLLTLTVVAYVLFGMLRMLISDVSDWFDYLRIFVEYTLFFFISRDIFSDYRLVEQQVLLWVYVSAIVSMFGLVEYFLGGVDLIYSRAAGQIRIISTLFNPNALGWYLAFTSALIIGLLTTQLRFHHVHRAVLLGILLANIAAIYLTGSRGSAAVVIVIFILSLLLNKHFSYIIISIFISVSVFGILLFIQNYASSEQLRVLRLEGTFTRVTIYSNAIFYYLSLSPVEIFIGATPNNLSQARFYGLVSDSQYFMMIYYGGIVGVVLLLTIQVLVGVRLLLWAMQYQGVFPSLGLAYAAIILTSAIGNSLTIFPHAVFFLVIIGIAANHRRIKATDVLQQNHLHARQNRCLAQA